MAAALGGTQSLHTNGFDEALGLPTERAAKIALRTQQIVGYESGIADTVDPLAGSYFVESLTDEVEKAAWDYLERIDAHGRGGRRHRGPVHAGGDRAGGLRLRQGHRQRRQGHHRGEQVRRRARMPAEVFPIDPELQRSQMAAVGGCAPSGTRPAVDAALADVEAAARGTQNLLAPMKVALGRMATLGEVSDMLPRGLRGLSSPDG